MADRVSPSEMAFLTQETATAPMQVATAEVFEPPPEGFDYERLVALIGDRIAFVPRYRQRIQSVPARLANPVWVDDDDFDLTFHVRRSALPRPGSMEQLRELTARLVSRPLDRTRPLWETYLVEGLEEGRFAIISKSHHALVDGATTVDLGQLILDVSPEPPATLSDDWRPRPGPSLAGLIVGAVTDALGDPASVIGTVRTRVDEVAQAAERARESLQTAASALGAAPPAHEGALSAALSQQRRIATVDTALDHYRKVRALHGGTVNDVVLAVVSGALRTWLMTRGEPVHTGTRVRAMVPMSVVDEEGEPTSLGSQVEPHLLSLPVGEPSPVMRLHQVSYALRAHKETGNAVAARKLAGISGFAPTTFHALGSRVAASLPRRTFSLVVTNVPGPQFPLYAYGARMLASYPVLPLLPGQPLAIGVTSYDGRVYYGIDADYDAVQDVEVLAQCVTEALEELVDTTRSTRQRAPRGRARPKRES